MSVIISSDLVLSTEVNGDAPNANNPLIGWHQLATVSNVVADSELASAPAINLANALTHLLWRSGSTAAQTVRCMSASPDPIDYVAVAGHNFGSGQVSAGVDGDTLNANTRLLLTFHGPNNSTTFTDISLAPKTFTAHGGAFINATLGPFGSCGQFDGVDDYIDTPADAALNLGSDNFTLRFRFSCTTPTGTFPRLAAQAAASFAAGDSAWMINLEPGDVIRFFWSDGTNAHTLVGTTPFNDATNTGFHLLAIVRNGGTLTMYLDGAVEATTSISGAIQASTQPLTIGSSGAEGGAFWQGFVAEWELIVGEAMWTAPFTVPDVERPWKRLVNPIMPAADSPMLFRFAPQVLRGVRLVLTPSGTAPIAAVMYVGKLLVLQRRIYVGHKPLLFNEQVDSSVGLNDRGQYLGEIVLSAWNVGQVAQDNVTPEFYRSEIEPWRKQGLMQRQPFFFAWRPGDYPAEVAYCWPVKGSNLDVSNQLANGMMQFSLNVQGIVS